MYFDSIDDKCKLNLSKQDYHDYYWMKIRGFVDIALKKKNMEDGHSMGMKTGLIPIHHDTKLIFMLDAGQTFTLASRG